MNKLDASKLYDRYRIVIATREGERICGGVPYNKNLIDKWIAARTGHNDELTKQQVAEAADTAPEPDAEEITSGLWTGFASDEKGLFLHSRSLKAMFRESSTLLGITKKKRGSKQIVQHGFEVKALDGSQRIRFLTSPPVPLAKPSGDEEKPIHVMTAQGPRTALKRFDYVEGVTIEFEVWVLKTAPQETRHIGADDLELMLTHAQENGLGANRSQGEGKFDVVEFSKVA